MADYLPIPDSTEQSFSYDGVGEAIVQRARAIAKKWSRGLRDLIFELGGDLLEIKQELPHGRFQPYVEQEIGISMRMAQLAMRAAEKLGSKSEIVSHLPVTTIYLISAPSTPADVRDEIVDQLAAGKRPSPAEIRNKITQSRLESNNKNSLGTKTNGLALASSNLLSPSMTITESSISTKAAEEFVKIIFPKVSDDLNEAVRLLNLCTNKEIIDAIDRYRMPNTA